MTRWCMVPEVCCATGGWMDRRKKWHIEVGVPPKKHSRIQKDLSSTTSKSELCTANNTCLFIASILYHGINQKPVAHMFYTKNKLFETPGFKKCGLVLLKKYIHFVDISTLGESYNRQRKLNRSMSTSWNAGSHYLHLKKISLLMKPCFSGKVAWDGSNSSEQSKHALGWKALFSQKHLVAMSGIPLFTQAMIHWLKKETYQYQATNSVMSLCEKVLDEGRCLFVDN